MVTADTYTSVLPDVQRRCADATAHLVLAAARRTRKKIKNKARKSRPHPRPKTGAPAPTAPASRQNPRSADRDTPTNSPQTADTHIAPT